MKSAVKTERNEPREFLATRRSLVERLGDWNDRKRWQQFFDSYWKLIHRAARKAGLTESEAQEVVQETLITVAKKIDQLKYDPAIGSFKGWLLNITRWRIADQFRKRKHAGEQSAKTRHAEGDTATIERIADPAGFDLDAAWDEEWHRNLLQAATERVKKKVSAKAVSDFRLLRLEAMAGAEGGEGIAREHRAGLSGQTSLGSALEEGDSRVERAR